MPHLRLPWNTSSAVSCAIMKKHAKLDRDMFAARWVTLGLRVDVNCAPKGLMMSMVLFFYWLINENTLETIAAWRLGNGQWCCEWLDDLQHKHRLLQDFQ